MSAAALTTQGIALADLTPEAFLHYVWESRDHGLTFKGRGEAGRGQFPGSWPGRCSTIWATSPPARRRRCGPPCSAGAGRSRSWSTATASAIGVSGNCLLDYLQRREPEMDYSTLDQLSRSLAGLFWAKIEALAPGQPDLRISAELYQRWREALGTHQDGRKQREEFESILRAVRSFYTDLHSWAVEEPGNGHRGWRRARSRTARCAGSSSANGDARSGWTTGCASGNRCCPCLVAHLEDRYSHLRALLHAASPLVGGETVTSTAGPINASGPPPMTGAPGGAVRPTPGSVTSAPARTSMSPPPRTSPSGNSPRWKSFVTRVFA